MSGPGDVRTQALEVIQNRELDPAMPPDPATVLAVLCDMALLKDICARDFPLLRRSPGVLGVVASGVSDAVFGKLPVDARENGSTLSWTLIDAVCKIDSMRVGFLVMLQARQIGQQAATLLDALHAQRQDADSFPSLMTVSYPEPVSAWRDIVVKWRLVPHVDSLTGHMENLQMLVMSIRHYRWLPRDMHLIGSDGPIAVLPAGSRFQCTALEGGLYAVSISASMNDVQRSNVYVDGPEQLRQSGFRVSNTGDGLVDVDFDSDAAYSLGVVVGPSTRDSPPLSRLVD